jgi:hypothetical protein
MKDGLSKSVRVRGEDSGSTGLMLLANGGYIENNSFITHFSVGKSLFFPETTLLDYLLSHYNCRDVRDLERFADKFSSELKKLTLVTTHLAKNRIFVCDGVDSIPVRKKTFSIEKRDENGVVLKSRQVSVVEYFEQKYKNRIACNYLPCVYHQSRDRDGSKTKNYYPIDVLKIVGGQRVPSRKMDVSFGLTLDSFNICLGRPV